MYFLETNIKRFSKASHIELFSMENKEQISGWFDLDIRFEEYRVIELQLLNISEFIQNSCLLFG